MSTTPNFSNWRTEIFDFIQNELVTNNIISSANNIDIWYDEALMGRAFPDGNLVYIEYVIEDIDPVTKNKRQDVPLNIIFHLVTKIQEKNYEKNLRSWDFTQQVVDLFFGRKSPEHMRTTMSLVSDVPDESYNKMFHQTLTFRTTIEYTINKENAPAKLSKFSIDSSLK